MSGRELLLRGYHRAIVKEWNVDIPDDIVLLIALFFPKFIDFEGASISLTDEEKKLITNWLIDTVYTSKKPILMSLTSTLLYDMDKDGDEASDYHDKCDNNPNTFAIIQIEDYDHIIGFYVNKPIAITPVYDDKVFICVIRSCFKDKGPEIFRTKTGDDGKGNMSYHCTSNGDFPLLGTMELYLESKYIASTCDPDDDEFFEISGNTLIGGEAYNSECSWYEALIEHFNVFRIDL